jgi:coenzyme PQQ biosynthesis enzyme PqqE
MTESSIDTAARPSLDRRFRLQWEAAQKAHVLLYPEGMIKLNGSAGEILEALRWHDKHRRDYRGSGKGLRNHRIAERRGGLRRHGGGQKMGGAVPVNAQLKTPGPPLWLLLELTYRCPLHCAFCYNPTDFTRTGPELDTEHWLRVLREARALGAVQLGLSGGEPLARDDLEIIIAEAHKLGFYINLITSGVGLTETRIAAFKEAGLDHIQLSFQDSTRQMNDFLSSTRTFDLKSKVAALIKKYDYPMVLNVVLHRLNIDHVEEILNMADRLGAEYVELANTQYYGWAYHNRQQLMPSRAQVERAEAVTKRFRERDGRPMKIYFVVPDYFERRPKALHERVGLHFPDRDPGWHCAALPCGAHAAGFRVSECTRPQHASRVVRVESLHAFSRRRLDEGALSELPGEGARLRRLPLPGVHAHRGCGQRRPGVRLIAASSSGDRGRGT